jgi:hypothetical protein
MIRERPLIPRNLRLVPLGNLSDRDEEIEKAWTKVVNRKQSKRRLK